MKIKWIGINNITATGIIVWFIIAYYYILGFQCEFYKGIERGGK